MKIQIENFYIETNEHGGFNLIELKKSVSREKKEYINESILAFNITLESAVKRIVSMNLHYNPNIVSLRQYVVDYKNEVKKIQKLVELEKIKLK